MQKGQSGTCVFPLCKCTGERHWFGLFELIHLSNAQLSEKYPYALEFAGSIYSRLTNVKPNSITVSLLKLNSFGKAIRVIVCLRATNIFVPPFLTFPYLSIEGQAEES